MSNRGISCLIISNLGKTVFANFCEWLSDESHIEFLIFPIDGDPLCLVTLTQASYRERSDPWVDSIQVSPVYSEGIAAKIKKLGFAASTIGVVGLEPIQLSTEGNIPYKTWSAIKRDLPEARFEDATWWLTELALPKSEEELNGIKRAAEIAEDACSSVLNMAKPGVAEDDIYRTFVKHVVERRAEVSLFLMGSGPTTMVQRPPEWLQNGSPPKIMRAGYLMTFEADVKFAKCHSQVQLCIAFSPVDELHKKCYNVSKEVVEEAAKALHPGTKFADVGLAVEKPLVSAKAWHPGPMIHSMNPQILRSPHAMDYSDSKISKDSTRMSGGSSSDYFRMTRGSDIVLKKGMAFEVEPCVCLNDHRVLLGGTMIVTEDKPAVLNRIPFEMQVI